MYSAFRPAARRLLSISPSASLSAAARSRSIATRSTALNTRPTTATTTTLLLRTQRRWNSDETKKNNIAEKIEIETEKVNVDAETGTATTTTQTAEVEIPAETPTPAQEANETAIKDSTATFGREEEAADSYASPTPNPVYTEGQGNTSRPATRSFRPQAQTIPPTETVYIGNLFFDVTADDLKARMQAFGVVTNCVIVHDSRGLSKGFGYITFEDVESAKRAVAELNQQIYEGRRVIVQFSMAAARQRQVRKPSKTLYIGNISFDLTDREINDLFKSVRNIVEVRVAVDRETGQPRGFAHADFLDVSSAQAAAEILASKAPHGRRLKIDFGSRPKQHRTRDTPNDREEGAEPF